MQRAQSIWDTFEAPTGLPALSVACEGRERMKSYQMSELSQGSRHAANLGFTLCRFGVLRLDIDVAIAVDQQQQAEALRAPSDSYAVPAWRPSSPPPPPGGPGESPSERGLPQTWGSPSAGSEFSASTSTSPSLSTNNNKPKRSKSLRRTPNRQRVNPKFAA
jgi:hypothetical protein